MMRVTIRAMLVAVLGVALGIAVVQRFPRSEGRKPRPHPDLFPDATMTPAYDLDRPVASKDAATMQASSLGDLGAGGGRAMATPAHIRSGRSADPARGPGRSAGETRRWPRR